MTGCTALQDDQGPARRLGLYAYRLLRASRTSPPGDQALMQAGFQLVSYPRGNGQSGYCPSDSLRVVPARESAEPPLDLAALLDLGSFRIFDAS